MKKIAVFLIVFLSIIYGCSTSFNYKTTKRLKIDYQYSQKTDDLIFFYNIKESNQQKVVDLNMKNISNLFISNLVFDITDDIGKYGKFLSVGNIKNLNSKQLTLEFPKQVEKIIINYKYTLISEDIFLKPDKTGMESYDKTSTVIILLK
ncbi:MAG: hypothetical protein K6348_07450 [Deferribacterales bacterium]